MVQVLVNSEWFTFLLLGYRNQGLLSVGLSPCKYVNGLSPWLIKLIDEFLEVFAGTNAIIYFKNQP